MNNIETRQEIKEKHFKLSPTIRRLTPDDTYWQSLIEYAENCSWEHVGSHLADMMRRNTFADWEAVFACLLDGEIVGFCTFLKEDFYPENRYTPWISTVFVDEKHRGQRLSFRMIETVICYAREQGFKKVYIPSDMIGFYEKCGFAAIDTLINYAGDTDTIFMKEI